MKPTRPTPRLCLALASILFVLTVSLFLTGCTTGGDSNNGPDHSQHSGHNM
jgi:hypothetical protein